MTNQNNFILFLQNMRAVTAILLIFIIFSVNSAVVTVARTGAKTATKYFCTTCNGKIIKLDAYVNVFQGFQSYLCTPTTRTNCFCTTLRFVHFIFKFFHRNVLDNQKGMISQRNQLNNLIKNACGGNSLEYEALEMKALELEELANSLEENVEEFE
jgi:hypothetical protein